MTTEKAELGVDQERSTARTGTPGEWFVGTNGEYPGCFKVISPDGVETEISADEMDSVGRRKFGGQLACASSVIAIAVEAAREKQRPAPKPIVWFWQDWRGFLRHLTIGVASILLVIVPASVWVFKAGAEPSPAFLLVSLAVVILFGLLVFLVTFPPGEDRDAW